MNYVLISGSEVVQYPYTINQLRIDNQNTSFPISPTLEQLAEFGVYPVVPSAPPSYDRITENLNEIDPVLEDSIWVQQWSVTPATAEEIVQRLEQKRQSMNVTPFQAKAALLNAGHLDEVEAVINDPTTDPIVKLAWTNAIEYRRLSPMVSGIALALGWTEDQLDDLFTAAAQITA